MNHECVGMVPFMHSQSSGLKVNDRSWDYKYLMNAEYGLGEWQACCIIRWLPSKVGSDLWEAASMWMHWEATLLTTEGKFWRSPEELSDRESKVLKDIARHEIQWGFGREREGHHGQMMIWDRHGQPWGPLAKGDFAMPCHLLAPLRVRDTRMLLRFSWTLGKNASIWFAMPDR